MLFRSGVTSAECVTFIKRLTGAQKVGHGGTLDPFADGVLPIGINRGTKLLQEFIDGNKTYAGFFGLGYRTDTLDIEGKIESISDHSVTFSLRDCEPQRQKLVGTYEQQTPRYSARKVGGKKLYELARKNKVVDALPRKKVTIFDFELGPINVSKVHFSVTCSKGTYVRQLVQDLLEDSIFDGTLEKLTRIRVGPFHAKDSITHHQFLGSLYGKQPFQGSWCHAL